MRPRAFTLLEMVLVVAIMATIAGTVVALTGDLQDTANRDIRRHEMSAVREALLRFHADTGFFPGEGPFDLDTRPGGFVPAGAQPAQWHDHAANLRQLVENPLAATSHPLRVWDPDRRRGWHGPYLETSCEGRVALPFVDGRAPPADQDLESTPLPDLIPAVADPDLRQVPAPGQPFHWTGYLPPGDVLQAQGQPYLVFLPRLADGSVDRGPTSAAQVRCLGNDRRVSVAPGTDDLQVYLFR